MIEKKDIVISIILSIVTCGIYGLIWFISMTDDVKRVSDDDTIASGGLALVFTILTCGIYGYYWAYKMGELLHKADVVYGMEAKDNSIIFLVLQIFGLGIVNYALIQSELNKIADIEK